MRCKYCKGDRVYFLINVGDDNMAEHKFDKYGRAYTCEDCGKCSIEKTFAEPKDSDGVVYK